MFHHSIFETTQEIGATMADSSRAMKGRCRYHYEIVLLGTGNWVNVCCTPCAGAEKKYAVMNKACLSTENLE